MTAAQQATRREDFQDFYSAQLADLVVLAHVLAGPEDAYRIAQESLLLAWRRWRTVSELARPDEWTRDACARIATASRRRLLSPAGPVLILSEPHERRLAHVRGLPRREAQQAAVDLVLDRPGTQVGARAAVEALREEARYLDPVRGMADLAVARRRHLVRSSLVVVVVLGVVFAFFWWLKASHDETDPLPDDPSGAGALVTTLDGDGTTGKVVLQRGSSRLVLSQLSDGTPLVAPDDLEVSPSGDSIAVVGDDRLQVAGLGDDRTATSVSCLRCLYVDWFRNGVLLVTSYDGGGAHTHVYETDGSQGSAVRPPEGVGASGYSPDRLRMVGVEEVGRGDERRSRLFLHDDTSGVRSPLDATETAPGRFIYDVSWSPDGRLIGYIEAGEYDGNGIAAQDYRLMVVSPSGSEAHEVADLGRCYCVQMADPRFAWSPDGASLLAVTVSTRDARDSSRVRVFSVDGRAEADLDGGAPVDWGPKGP